MDKYISKFWQTLSLEACLIEMAGRNINQKFRQIYFKVETKNFHWKVEACLIAMATEKYELGQNLVWLKWLEEEEYGTLKEGTKYIIQCPSQECT